MNGIDPLFEVPLPDRQLDAPEETEPKPELDLSRYETMIINAISSYEKEVEKIENRRILRRNDCDVMKMRAEGKLLTDETYIPDHTIDVNVRSEKPVYLRYLGGMASVLTLKPRIPNPETIAPEVQKLERWFTRGAKYDGWNSVWQRITDAGIFHGYSAFEVIFDPTKPLHFGIDYIRREDLPIPDDCTNLNELEVLPRRTRMTVNQFEQMFMANEDVFEADKARSLIAQRANRRWEYLDIYIVYINIAGEIYTSMWEMTTKWLRKPTKLDIGLREETEAGWVPAPVKMFPVVPFRYQETEEGYLLSIPGRAKIDAPTQEAIGQLVSAIVNGCQRASGLYPIRKPNAQDDSGNTEVELKHGIISRGDITALNLDWPNPMALSVVQAIAVRNRQGLGQIDFAAMSRQDTAKSATELKLAEQQSMQLSATQVALLASSILQGYTLAFEIARSQALSGELPPHELPDVPPEIVAMEFGFAASGDLENTRRAEKLLLIEKMISLLGNTPAGMFFLKLYIQSNFPEEYGTIEPMLGQNQDETKLVAAELTDALTKILPQLPPNEQQELTQLIAIARKVVGGPGNNLPPQPAGEGQAGPNPAGAEPQQVPRGN